MLHPSPATERRITLKLLAYWERMRKGRDMPAEADIDPEHLQDLWDHCFVLRASEIKKKRADFNYTHLGESVKRAYSGGVLEDDSDLTISPATASLSEHFERVVATGKPVIDEGEFRNLHNEIIRYRQCLMPLGKNGTVQAVFGGMRFKVFTLKN